jgi:F-type H+-transporting ATPase subunit epsilon
VTLSVSLVMPDRQLWSGQASIVIAKTTEGDIGVLTGHSPVFGILAAGSVVEIVPGESSDQPRVKAAVSGGFLSVADDKVSILVGDALLADEVDIEQARSELAAALAESGPGAEDSPAVKYARARLRAAGSQD